MTTYAENMSDEARAYYGEKGWKRAVIGGFPVRVRNFDDAATRRAKKAIQAAVKAGASVERHPDAPRFRFAPAPRKADPFGFGGIRRGHLAKPGPRTSYVYKGGYKSRWWKPEKIEATPNYSVPMRGDDSDMTHARHEYAKGDPDPLRKLLAVMAAERRALDLAA